MDKKNQKLYGPCKKAQVCVMRGLFSPQKQPVYYDFDKNMDKKLLNEIITKMENNGFKVYGAVFDMGNHTLIKQLKLKDGNYFMENPVDASRNVYMFPDVPHIIKRARNHLIGKV